MAYRLLLIPAAERDLERLPRQAQQRLAPVLESLADDPRPPGATALQGREALLRVRVGSYRIIYRVRDPSAEVEILLIGDRREVYRKLVQRLGG